MLRIFFIMNFESRYLKNRWSLQLQWSYFTLGEIVVADLQLPRLPSGSTPMLAVRWRSWTWPGNAHFPWENHRTIPISTEDLTSHAMFGDFPARHVWQEGKRCKRCKLSIFFDLFKSQSNFNLAIRIRSSTVVHGKTSKAVEQRRGRQF